MQGKKLKEAEESYAETYFPLISNGWSELKAVRIFEEAIKYLEKFVNTALIINMQLILMK